MVTELGKLLAAAAELQGALEELGFLPECWPAESCAVPPAT